MDIKEIALNIADKSGAVAYSPAPLRAVRGYSFTFEQLQNFAEALIAEIAKWNEPVGEWKKADYGDYPQLTWAHGFTCKIGTKLYALPPAASQIEQETAEACAEMLDSMYVTERGAEAIRSGAWKEFKKS